MLDTRNVYKISAGENADRVGDVDQNKRITLKLVIKECGASL